MELCIITLSIQYYLKDVADQQEGDVADQQKGEGYYSRLENSLEFLAGITGFLFVALESYVSGKEEAQRRLTAPMVTSFCVCVVGVFTMFLATIPPSSFSIRTITTAFDFFVGVSVSLVMFVMMHALVKLRALIVMGPGFLIFLVYVLFIAVRTCNDARPNNDPERGDNTGANSGSNPGASTGSNPGANPGAVEGGANPNKDYEPPASLELMKVTFVGFLAVSIPSISAGSVDRCTECFTHLAAAAIVSGLMWRILTHLKSADGVPKAAMNLASIITHFCIVIAVVPFAIMAGKVLPTSATAPAPAPVP